jgi:transposase, IS5 family
LIRFKEIGKTVGKKVYSLFEPYTEWLYKGKSNKRVELGRNILVASGQWGFIVYHQVVERQAEVSLTIPLADRLLSRLGEDAIESISFDKGFYKGENLTSGKSLDSLTF